jgi:nucleotide-binding universal stress UspA family protein
MRKILFPFELDNPVYREAYIYGIKFARNINAELIVLNVFKVERGNCISKEKYESLKKHNWFEAYNAICKFNKYYLEEHAKLDTDLKIRFNYRFVSGILIDEIRNIAREDEVDLIVLPISDSTEFNKRQLRIIRDNIFEKNRASLLVVPFGCEYRPVKIMVFAADLKKLNDYEAYLPDVINYAKLFDCSIHFIHITSKEKAEDWSNSNPHRMVMQAIEKNKRHVFKHLYGKNLVESVSPYVQETHADLLLVIKHEDLSNEISLNLKVPVLVMREKRI